MSRHGLADRARICRTNYSDEGGYKAGMSLLGCETRPTAIMAGADVAALGVWRAAHELGLRVPEDVSVVGYNNTAVADLATVQLTSVDQAGHNMGANAARLLIERVEGKRDRAVQTSMTPRLVIRSSTSAPHLTNMAERPQGRLTTTGVAREAGVSLALVSYALNQPRIVAPPTRQCVGR
ncbi:substrate-binding domain-containing protein [Streptomyces sp. NPDC102279]|uniref:substrate-binding domain-containing protein n=1 Tax=Streptomyces sp. NPDC102279 TaxID=3366153 RepID=UPI00382A737D